MGVLKIFDGTSFVEVPIVADHVNLTGLSDNDHTQYVLKTENIKRASINVESPTATEYIGWTLTEKAITISEIRAVLRGSSTPSVKWTIRHGTDRAATGAEVVTSGTTTTSTTTGDDVTSFNDATIIANSHIWLETTAQSGTVDELTITFVYTED